MDFKKGTNEGLDYDISGAEVPEDRKTENPSTGSFSSDCEYSTTAKGGVSPGGGGQAKDWQAKRPSGSEYR